MKVKDLINVLSGHENSEVIVTVYKKDKTDGERHKIEGIVVNIKEGSCTSPIEILIMDQS